MHKGELGGLKGRKERLAYTQTTRYQPYKEWIFAFKCDCCLTDEMRCGVAFEQTSEPWSFHPHFPDFWCSPAEYAAAHSQSQLLLDKRGRSAITNKLPSQQRWTETAESVRFSLPTDSQGPLITIFVANHNNLYSLLHLSANIGKSNVTLSSLMGPTHI